MKIFSKNTWGVDVNNAWRLTCKASCLKKIELRSLISGFDFAFVGGTESVRGFPTARSYDSAICLPFFKHLSRDYEKTTITAMYHGR